MIFASIILVMALVAKDLNIIATIYDELHVRYRYSVLTLLVKALDLISMEELWYSSFRISYFNRISYHRNLLLVKYVNE